ncbi:MAG: helix-turn-helix domain-containing protein [Bdellovibrionales bacterium]|nr:helix-turn-helix domain-containing protein [Bdellovibrionales bacterium]
MNILAQNLAKNVVTLRKKQGLTQMQLAKISGLTRPSVALIESGSANPTLEVLVKLSQGLSLSVDELLSAPRAECQHIPADEIPLDVRSRKGVTLRKLLPHTIPATEMDDLILDVGGRFTGSPHVEGTKEYFVCIEGSIDIAVLGQVFALKKGDVLTFPGDKPHSYRNRGKTKARGVSVVLFHPHAN